MMKGYDRLELSNFLPLMYLLLSRCQDNGTSRGMGYTGVPWGSSRKRGDAMAESEELCCHV